MNPLPHPLHLGSWKYPAPGRLPSRKTTCYHQITSEALALRLENSN